MTQFVVPDLVEMLSVVDAGARTSSDILTGPPFPTPHGRAFGGQVMGQSLAAMYQTVAAAMTRPPAATARSLFARRPMLPRLIRMAVAPAR